MSVPIRHYSPEPKRRQNREEKIPKRHFMGSQSRLSLVPATRTGRHHRYLTSTTACWLISRCIIIGHSPLRACPPQTGCTPAFPLGSLDAIFFTAWLAERTSARLLQECHCAPVTAHETANVSELLDMAGRIWRDSILRSEPCIPLRHFSMCVLSACVVSTHET